MLTAEARRRLTIVLVGARNPQNIGAAARAMQDFGFSDLRVVNEFAPPFEAARLEASSAVAAGEIMRSAQLFPSLPEAIAECALVVGTTAVGGRDPRLPVQTLREAVAQILATLGNDCVPHALDASQRPALPGPSMSQASRVALLFGSEKTGLTNEQLSHCSLLLTIPLFAPEGRHLSMNLGQSVAVCLYELTREGFEGVRERSTGQIPAANSADRERLTQLLLELMEQSGYNRRFPANARIEVVRQLTGGLGESHAEAVTWMGFFKQLLGGRSL